MTAAWPAGVPQEAHAGTYSERPVGNLAAFQPEVGPPKLRRRTSLKMRDLRFEIVMTMSQYDTLVTFWRDDVADGSLPFTTKHPRNLGGADVTMLFKDQAEPPAMRQHGLTSCAVAIDVWLFE